MKERIVMFIRKNKSISTPPYSDKGFTLLVNPLRSVSRCFRALHSRNFKPRLPGLRTSGFTLAETLITLVIVGVVAALTVPTLITKYQKEQTVTQLKKAYTTLSQAVKLSEIDNGSCDNWNYSLSANNFYNTYLKKYMPSVKDFGTINLTNFGIDYKKANGNSTSETPWDLNESIYRISLNDGSIYFIGYGTTYKIIYVDINGFKKPNKLGRDLFSFTIQPKYKVVPNGYGLSASSFGTVADRNVLIGNNGYACNKQMLGIWCAALIMRDNWQIKDDYPW